MLPCDELAGLALHVLQHVNRRHCAGTSSGGMTTLHMPGKWVSQPPAFDERWSLTMRVGVFMVDVRRRLVPIDDGSTARQCRPWTSDCGEGGCAVCMRRNFGLSADSATGSFAGRFRGDVGSPCVTVRPV